MRRLFIYVFNIGIAFDQVGNALLGGYPDETLSTRAAKARRENRRWGCVLCRALEVFDRNHCKRALVGKILSLRRRYLLQEE